jgi:hypothetical protein
MAVSPQSPIKRLLHGLPRGTPIDMDELAKRGAAANAAYAAEVRRAWRPQSLRQPSEQLSLNSLMMTHQRR